MRIGKNELEVIKILAETNKKRASRGFLKQEFSPGCGGKKYKIKALSRALRSLAEKGLIMVYAEITERKSWELVRVDEDCYGKKIVVMRKPYDGKIKKPKFTETSVGLTEKGEKELNRRL